MEGIRSPAQAAAAAAEAPSGGASSWEDDPKVGVIPRAISQLFSPLNSLANCDYSIKVSFIELYNEELTDLISEATLPTDKTLRIYDDKERKGSVIIPGLEEVMVKSKAEVYNILQRGAEKRQKAATLMNTSNSSRSHSVFTLSLYIKEKSIEGDCLVIYSPVVSSFRNILLT